MAKPPFFSLTTGAALQEGAAFSPPDFGIVKSVCGGAFINYLAVSFSYV